MGRWFIGGGCGVDCFCCGGLLVSWSEWAERERRGEGEGEQCKESYVLGGMRLPRNLIMGLRARK